MPVIFDADNTHGYVVFDNEQPAGDPPRVKRESKAGLSDYARALDSGLAQGVVGLAGGVGTFIQDPAANSLSGVIGAAHLADRGITWAMNQAGLDAKVNPTLQENARLASRFAAESRDAQLNDPSNLPARAGRYLQQDSERAAREIKARDESTNPELAAQQSNTAQAQGFWDNLAAIKDNPLAFTHTMARSLPDMAAGVGVGSALFRAGAGIGKVGTATTLSEAASSALSGRQGVYQQVLDMPAQTLEKSPRYQEVLQEAGGDPEKAKLVLANELADQVPLLTGAGTALGTVLTNRLFGGDATAKTIVGAERMTAREFGKRTAQDSVEEVLQGLHEDAVQQGAVVQADPSQKYDPLGSVAQNLAAGAAMGAGGHGLGYLRDNVGAGSPAKGTKQKEPTPPATTAPEAIKNIAQTDKDPLTVAPPVSDAEKALHTPVALTALDRVNDIDASAASLAARLHELSQPDSGYGPMFDPERTELAAQQAVLAQEKQDLTKDWPRAVSGLPSSFTTEAGSRVDAQYALMDAGDLITSHDEGLRKNPLYPPELQPRERDRAASEMQVSSIVQKLDPPRLGLSADAANGAPIVGADGLVESGNARTISLKRVYQADGQKAQDYKQFLRDNAAQFGIAPESVDGMAKPVLVRVRQTPVNRAEFARQANASTVAQMSPSEQAKSDANRIDSMEDLTPDDSGDFQTSRDFIRRFMSRLPMTEKAGMMDSDGKLSAPGYARVRNAVLAKAYGDSPVLARMTESMDDNLRNVSKALMMAAPKVAQMRGAIAAGSRFDADITPDLMASVEELSRLKVGGASVSDALAQADLMGEQRTPEARQLLQFLNDNMRRPRRMADFINAYMDALDAAGNPNQGSLLGDTVAPTKQDLLTAAERATSNEPTNTGTTTRDAAPPAGSQTGQEPGHAPGSGSSAESDGVDSSAARAGAETAITAITATTEAASAGEVSPALKAGDAVDWLVNGKRASGEVVRAPGKDGQATVRATSAEQGAGVPVGKVYSLPVGKIALNQAVSPAKTAKTATESVATGEFGPILTQFKGDAQGGVNASMFSRAKTEPLDDITRSLDEYGVSNNISERDGVITVSKIVVPKDQRSTGIGTDAMRRIVAYADRTGKHVALTPSADFGGNKSRLTEFYKRFGFKENKGRDRVFSVSESMVRENPDGKLLFSRRTSSGNRIPDVVIGHKLGDLNNHPDYAAAKAGDAEAALRIAQQMVDDDMVIRVREAANGADLIVPVVSVEATGRNKIPTAVAEVLAAKLGTSTDLEIVQSNSPKRTSMDGLERLLNPPVFDGPVQRGAMYVLVDDTVTQGGTFASLASHIRDNGGEVAGGVALTGKQYSAKLEPSSQLLNQVRERFKSVEPAFNAATGYGFDALTESEARYLVKHDNAESVRNRILEAGNEASRSNDAGAFAKSGSGVTAGIHATQAQSIVDTIRARWANAPDIVVATDMNDARIPKAVRDEDHKQRSNGAAGEPEGFYHDGKVYLLASQLSKPADVVRVLFHETLGHFGLRGVFGKTLGTVLDQLTLARRGEVIAKARGYGLVRADASGNPSGDVKTATDAQVWAAMDQSHKQAAAEEVLAVLAQANPQLGFVRRAVSAVRAWLRTNLPGFADIKMTDADIIANFILPARNFVENGEGGMDTPHALRYSRHMTKSNDVVGNQGGRSADDSSLGADENTGLPLNADGTVTLYHHTSSAAAKAIRATGTLKAAAEPDVYVTTQRETDTGYGDTAVAIRVNPDKLAIDDEFPDGRKDFRLNVGKPGGSIKVQVENESTAPDSGGANHEIRLSRGNGGGLTQPPPTPQPLNPWQKLKAKAADLTSAENIDKLIYEFQDKYIDLKRLREHIKAIGGTITDLNDAYQGEELYHARVAKRTQDFLADEIRPLMGDLRTRGVSMAALETYLHARHAPEANKAMAERNPTQDMIDAGKAKAASDVNALALQLQEATAKGAATRAVQDALTQAQDEQNNWRGAQAFKGAEEERLSLSGMSDAQAQAVMAALEPGKLPHMQALAARVDAINAKTLDTLDQYGLMDKASLQAWRSAYQYYIPLHRDEAHESSVSHPIGQGFSVKGDAAKRRTGSNEKVTHILGHIAQQREAALTRGEKNNVTKKLYLMATQNPDANYWSVDKPPMIESIDKKTGFVRTGIDPTYKNKPNVVMVRIGGKDAFITFNERNAQAVRLAEAVKNADVGDMGFALSKVAVVTRWFSAVNTQYNPVFGVINFLRDVQGAALNLSTTPIAGKQMEMASHMVAAMRAVYRNKSGKAAASPANAEWMRLWGELQDVGGITGYRDMYADPKDRVKALDQELEKLDRGNASAAAHAVRDLLVAYNEAMENSTRLAAYKVALDGGMSRPQAASLAKNLTVNFNRKGRKGREINSAYAFFNAAIQGSARMGETLRGPMGKRIMLGGVALGMANAMIGIAMMGGGDDDDNGWNKIPDFIKASNLIVPLGREDYFAIPMPLGFNVLPNMGRVVAEAVFGGPDKTLAGASGKVLASLLDALNPLGGGTDPSQTIMPTVLDPAVALWRNKDWTRRPIYREDNKSLDPTPGHTRTKDSASTLSKWVSKAVNQMTGGTDYQPGAISWTPDQIDYVIGQVTGGVGRELMKTNQVITAPFTGDELPSYKIPLFGRFFGNTRGPSGQSEKFYDNVREINMAENEVRGRAKEGVDWSDYAEKNAMVGLIGAGNGAEKQVSQLRKMSQHIAQQGLDGYQDEVRDINEQIGEVMKGLNREVVRAKKEMAAQ